MKKENEVTISGVYDLVDRKISEVNQSMSTRMTEVNQSINRLADAFSAMESGRLTKVEQHVANIEGRLMMIPLLVSIGINTFFFIMNFVLFKK